MTQITYIEVHGSSSLTGTYYFSILDNAKVIKERLMQRQKPAIHKHCVACGNCVKACPTGAISIRGGVSASVDNDKCAGCGKCAAACPADAIEIKQHKKPNVKKGHWYDYLWLTTIVYFILGFFNILFAWLGLACFFVPLAFASLGGGKGYCGRYCGRGQLLEKLGGVLGLSVGLKTPRFLRSPWFRYAFLIFFMTMFGTMIYSTWLVFSGAPLRESVTLLWTLRLPWEWADTASVAPWIAQFAFGFYGVMLTSTVLGLISMILFKPRTWCVWCPMGTMTQGICKIKDGVKRNDGGKSEENIGAAEGSRE
ncbi:MAG: 4Fe-4S dicluster domain-containing protein [Eubacteriales bacterium]